MAKDGPRIDQDIGTAVAPPAAEMAGDARPGWRTPAAIFFMLAAVTAAHYLSAPTSIVSHNVFRRLYYLPIVWAAFYGGLRWGLGLAVATTTVYVPHAFFLSHHHLHDPAPTIDKILECVLYFGVGSLAGFLVDRERRARARQEVETQARMAAERRIDRLAGLVHLSRGLAHEIRNPLGGIQGAIEILADEIPASSPRREMVEVGLRETSRLDRVLSQFLDFARPREPVMKPFPANDVVRAVVDLQGEVAQRQGVTLASQVAGSPNGLGDAEQLTQVLLNLVRNALQATPPGGKVTVSCRKGGRLVFEVEDTGRGIAPELAESLYDPYVSDHEDGVGLGLSISALLVRQHGGTLTHAPRPGGGTTFRFDVPATGAAS